MSADAKVVEEIMTKAQEFASCWSTVGGRFDSGSALEDAERIRSELRAMVAGAIQAALLLVDQLKTGPLLTALNALSQHQELTRPISSTTEAMEVIRAGMIQCDRFQPDWSRIEAAQQSLREHMQMIAERDAEIEKLRSERNGARAMGRVLSQLTDAAHELGVDSARKLLIATVANQHLTDALIDARRALREAIATGSLTESPGAPETPATPN